MNSNSIPAVEASGLVKSFGKTRAVEGVEIIFIPLPGFTISAYGQVLAPLLEPQQIVVIMPGTLAALEFRETLRTSGHRNEVIIAETGGLPFATRLIGPGRVKTFHIRKVCGLAAVPGRSRGMLLHGCAGLRSR